MGEHALRPAGPEPRQHVTLDVPLLGRVGARVAEVEDGELLLSLYTEADDLIQDVRHLGATVEFTTRRGLFRLTGLLAPGEEPDSLRFQLEGEVELVQRRQFARVDAVRPVSLSRPGSEPIDTYTINISGGGVLIAGPSHLPLGEEIRLRLRLMEGHPPVEVAGRIVRETAEGFKGVHIDRIAPNDRELLIHYVFDRERIARKVARDG